MIDFNLDLCRRMGADVSINVQKEKDYRERIVQETDGGVEAVLDMAGNKAAVDDGFKILRKMGTFTAFGIPPAPFEFDFADNIVFKGARIIGINGRKMFQTWYQLHHLLNSGAIDISPIITHRFPFSDFIQAIETSVSPNENKGKVVLIPMQS